MKRVRQVTIPEDVRKALRRAGERLRALHPDMNQEDIGLKYGLPKNVISILTTNPRNFTIGYLLKLRAALHEPLDDILGLSPIGRYADLDRADKAVRDALAKTGARPEDYGRPDDRSRLDEAKRATSPHLPKRPESAPKSEKISLQPKGRGR